MNTVAILIAGLSTVTISDANWHKLPPVPDSQGFAGSFAGASNNTLLVAGGANFPDKKPWEGGKKRWYDTVYALDKPDGKWTAVGKLPRPLGYGVSVTHRDRLICVGGSDADKHYADVFRLEFKSGKLVTSNLPPLPIAVANACGALVGDTLYVAGGQEKPDAANTLKKVFAMDLAAKELKWREVEAWPGRGRMLAVAASFDGAFWLIGGTDLLAAKDGQVVRQYLKDAWRYDTGKGWKRIADLPRSVVAAPSPAPLTESSPLVLGGDDGTQIGIAPEKHAGFSKRMLRYDSKVDKWNEHGDMPVAHVTTPVVLWNDRWVISGGEVRPGARSPEVWSIAAK